MRERMVILLDNVVESKGGAIVAGNGEANSIGAIAIRKPAAGAAGVPEVAESAQSGGVWLRFKFGNRAAVARPMATQR